MRQFLQKLDVKAWEWWMQKQNIYSAGRFSFGSSSEADRGHRKTLLIGVNAGTLLTRSHLQLQRQTGSWKCIWERWTQTHTHTHNITPRQFYTRAMSVVSPCHTCSIFPTLFCDYLQPLQMSALCFCSRLPNMWAQDLKKYPHPSKFLVVVSCSTGQNQLFSTGLMGWQLAHLLMTGIFFLWH